jgi:hypothetical protein
MLRISRSTTNREGEHMTRKDYVALALALRAAKPPKGCAGYEIVMQTWAACVKEIAKMCAQMAGQGGFKKDRFFDACGLES